MPDSNGYIHINRADFLQSLEMVRSGLAPKGIVEQTDCFLFKDGKIITFNDDIACKANSPLPQDFEYAVVAQSLMKIVAKLEEDELQVDPELNDGQIYFKGKGKWFGVNSIAKITVPLDKLQYPKDWFQLPNDFAEGLKIVQDCAGKDAQKFVATCIHMTPDHMESTDGYRVAQYRTKLPISRDYLVKKESIKHVIPLDMTEMGETNEWVHFRNASGLHFSCRRYIDAFPNIDKWLKVTGQNIALPKGLIEACERANVFSEEDTESNEVHVIVAPGKVKLKAQGITGRYYESKETDYTGDTVQFTVPPDLLANVIKKYNTCTIGRDRLRVAGEGFDYISAIGMVGED